MIATRVAKNEEELAKYDVAIKDSNGQLRSTYQILTDLSPKWEQMSKVEQVALGNTLAGTNQYKILAAIMSQMKPELDGLSTAQKAYNQALNSSGETMKQNAVYMQSIEARTTALKAEFENLVLGNGGLEDIGKQLISFTTNILKLINAIGGLTPVLTALAGILLTIKIESLISSFSKIYYRITDCISAFQLLRNSGSSLSETFQTMGVTANSLQLTLGALTAVATIGAMIWSKYQQAQLEARQEAENAVQSYNEYGTKLAETYDKIKNETTSKEELIKINKELSDSYDEEAAKLQDINDLRDESIKKLYEEYIAKNKQTAIETASEAQKGEEYLATINPVGQDKIKELEHYEEKLAELNKKRNAGIELSWIEEIQLKNISREYAKLNEEVSHYEDVINTNTQATENQNKKFIEFENELKGFNLNAFPDIKKELEEFSKGGNVDLTLRPVIDAEELNEKGYEAGKGVATVFSHTFSNEAGDVAMNFTPIMVNPETGETEVLTYDVLQEYASQVIEGKGEHKDDDWNLKIGATWTGEDAIQQASNAGDRICEISGQVAAAMVDTTDVAEDSVDALIVKYDLQEDAILDLVETQGLEYDEAVRILAAESKAADSVEALAKAYGISADTLKEWAKELGVSEKKIIQNADAMHLSIEDYYEYASAVKQAQDAISETNSTIDGMQDALTKAKAALEEYNQNGALTVDTFQDLMSISAQYLTSLINENGQIEINEQTLSDLVEQVKRDKIEELQLAEVSDILAYAFGDVDEMSGLAKNSISDAGDSAQTAGQKAQNSSGGWWSLAEAISAANAAAEGDVLDATHIEANIQKIHNAYAKLGNSIFKSKVDISAVGQAAKSAGKKGASAAKEAKDATKELNKELEETKKKYDTVIKWISKQYDKEIDKVKKAKDAAIKAEEAKIKAKEKEKDAALDAIEKEIKALDKQKEALKDQKEILDDRKDALKDEEDAIVDGIKTEIDALKELKDTRKDYWDAQIDALKKANEELKDNLELQEKLDALEKAKNTRVKIYKEGQGFVYDVDQTEVAKAQKALDEYLNQKAYEDELARLENLRDAELKNYEDRIKALENYEKNVQKIYDEKIKVIEKDIDALEKQMDELEKHKDAIEEHKDAVQEAYEAEIEELNNHKEATQEAYETEIEVYENYKQQFEDMVNAYEEEQNRLLAQQLTGINFENKNWMTRLDNLAAFVNEYNKLQKQLNTENTSVSNSANLSGGGGLPSSKKQSPVSDNSRYDDRGFKLNDTKNSLPYSISRDTSGSSKNKKDTITLTPKYDEKGYLLRNWASGSSSIPEDGLAIVGENPNQEIVIGSKLNNGQLMSLDRGVGVVNANSSKTLAGMLNQVGQFGASGFGSGNGTLNNNINNDSLTINGVTVQGANISDPETFVNGLLNLKAEALQRAYRHR